MNIMRFKIDLIKLLLLAVASVSGEYLQAQIDTTLIGNWALIKHSQSGVDTTLKVGSFFLQFDSERISYNLPVNRCYGYKWRVKEDTIIINPEGCTEVCCDNRYGNIYKRINYNGKYLISGNELEIRNSNGIFYFKRKD